MHIEKYEIVPQVGFGPIKFGMSPTEIRVILGEPTETKVTLRPSVTDPDLIKYLKGRHSEWHGDEPLDGKLPQITYQDNKAIAITVFKQYGPLIYKGMDLHKVKKRLKALETLAADEETYYYYESNFFFPKSGLCIPIPKLAKRHFYITQFLTEYMTPRLDFEMYEPSTALD